MVSRPRRRPRRGAATPTTWRHLPSMITAPGAAPPRPGRRAGRVPGLSAPGPRGGDLSTRTPSSSATPPARAGPRARRAAGGPTRRRPPHAHGPRSRRASACGARSPACAARPASSGRFPTTSLTSPRPRRGGLAPLIPNDPGRAGVPGGWEQMQWNFAGPFGVNAPAAWANLAAVGRPGGQGVIVAVLDTGVAYADHGRFRRSPDFSARQFVRGTTSSTTPPTRTTTTATAPTSPGRSPSRPTTGSA